MSDAGRAAGATAGPPRGVSAGVRLRRPMSSRVLAVAGASVAVALPLLVGEGSTVLDNAILAAAYVMAALGLNMVVGFAGLLDLGYVAFFAIGAHVTAMVASTYWADAAGGTGSRFSSVSPRRGCRGSTSTSCSSWSSRWS